MKISINQVQAAKMYQKMGKVKAAAGKPAASNPAHEVNLSKEAREIQSIKQKIAASPDVRTEKINELRRAIKQGTYHVSSQDIVDEMFRRAIADSMLKE